MTTLCTECNAKIPTLKTRLCKVNSDLHTLGLTYHQLVPYVQIDAILEQQGFESVHGCETENKLDCCVGEGKYLHVSFYKMPSGRFEVVAYVN